MKIWKNIKAITGFALTPLNLRAIGGSYGFSFFVVKWSSPTEFGEYVIDQQQSRTLLGLSLHHRQSKNRSTRWCLTASVLFRYFNFDLGERTGEYPVCTECSDIFGEPTEESRKAAADNDHGRIICEECLEYM